jgi:predicted MFS family arabinose efflux permease
MVFALANLLAALAPSYAALAAARVLLALAAATFMPAAYAVSVSLVGPEKRARAIAMVAGGLTVAVALGAPIGSVIAAWGNWRMTFVIVAVLAILAVGGLLIGLDRDLPVSHLSLGQRLSVLRRPAVLATLATMTAALAAGFVVFVYLAPLLAASTDLGPVGVTAAMFAGGIGGAIGNGVGGQLADRFGPVRVMSVLLAGLTLLFLLITPSAGLLSPAIAAPVLLAEIALWGGLGWAFIPAEASRLVQLAPDVAVMSLSLNSSAVYVGAALGAAIGGGVIAVGAPADLGIAAAGCALVGLALFGLSLRLARPGRHSNFAAQPAE